MIVHVALDALINIFINIQDIKWLNIFFVEDETFNL